MDRIQKQEVGDTVETIQKFLEASREHDAVPDERSLAARLCSESLVLFRAIITLASRAGILAKDNSISLERSYGRMQLWSDGYGVSRGDLDDILANSGRLKRLTLSLLASVGTILTDRNQYADPARIFLDAYQLVGLLPVCTAAETSALSDAGILALTNAKTLIQAAIDDCTDDSSSTCSSFIGKNTIEDILEELRTETSRFPDLDHLIKHPIFDTTTENPAPNANIADWMPFKAYCDRIEIRFPEAPDPLILRLGQANYERFTRCQSERETAQEPDPEPSASATAGTVIGSKFHDSGLGSSIPAASSYAETVMSYGGAGRQSIRIPPLPTEGKAKQPFPCITCGKTVSISNNSAWKQHLYLDLRPWVCLDEVCNSNSGTFMNRNDWVSHLALDHGYEPGWPSITCPLCFHPTGSGKLNVTKHLGSHLEEISLGALPPATIFDAGSDNSESADETTDAAPVEPDLVGNYGIKCTCNEKKPRVGFIRCTECKTFQHRACYLLDPKVLEHRCVECTLRISDTAEYQNSPILEQPATSLGRASSESIPQGGSRAESETTTKHIKRKTDEEWENHKDLLIDLYHSKGLSLSDIMYKMRTEHDFVATKQFNYRIVEIWQLRRYKRARRTPTGPVLKEGREQGNDVEAELRRQMYAEQELAYQETNETERSIERQLAEEIQEIEEGGPYEDDEEVMRLEQELEEERQMEEARELAAERLADARLETISESAWDSNSDQVEDWGRDSNSEEDFVH